MAQTLVNVRMDEEVKRSMEETCKELGITMSTAFNIFARKMSREKRIPFEVSIDPFYSENNIKAIKEITLSPYMDFCEAKQGLSHYLSYINEKIEVKQPDLYFN